MMTSFIQSLYTSNGKQVDSLLDRLEENVSKTPTKDALTFLKSGPNGGIIEAEYTYKELWDETEKLALHLVESGVQRGDMAVLVYPPSLDFMIAFIACLRAGIVAVPVFPPQPSRKDTLIMFSTIIESCGAKYALTNTSYSYMKKLSTLKENFLSLGRSSTPWPEDLSWIVTDSINKNSTESLPTIEINPSDLAFLQFTSGSTSAPKGVMISHHNLADNLTKITTDLEAVDDTIVVSWLPQYHDMGLIGSYLGVLYCGGSGYFLSPLTFLQRPAMWIEAISRFRGTHLQAPNFAFKLTARKFDSSNYLDSTKLDLSSVRHIINAAEPVTEDSIDAFHEKFVPFGLKKDVMFPTYGLAEHTVFVCSGGKQMITVAKKYLEVDGKVVEIEEATEMPVDGTSRMIGCGYPSRQNVDVKIVSTETFQPLEEDKVGEIWVRSDSKAGGYYMKPEISKLEFAAEIGVDPEKDDIGDTTDFDVSKGYLRTGDLGFMHKNELFICGRLKDLIIIGGRNYYPQDIEATAESTDKRIRPGCSAAFTVDPISGSDEEVGIVLEVREVPDAANLERECDQLVEALRGAITQEHSLSIAHIVLLQPKTVPKTSSGKIARARCRKGFLDKSLKSIYTKSYKTKASLDKNSNRSTNTPAAVASVGGGAEMANAPPRKQVHPESIRKLSKKQIMKKLLNDIAQHVPTPPAALKKDDALVTMMDSLTLSQFKGILEFNYATDVSDGYLFREGTTINKLVEVIKLGYAPDDNEDGGQPSEAVAKNSGAMVGKSKGLAGALGCPPGVKCVIM